MTEAERLVREAWELVHKCDGSYRHYVRGTILVQDTCGHWLDFPSWQAALDFTIARREEIRQVEEELACLNIWGRHAKHFPVQALAWQRIVARLIAARDDLKRGMREPAHTQNPDAHLGAVEA